MKLRSIFAFDTALNAHGRITVPHSVRAALGRNATGLLRVQLTPAAIAEELRQNGVTEDEVDRMADVQLERREQVIGFLLAEGALAAKGSRNRRAKGRRT